MHSYKKNNTWTWVPFINKEINNILNKKLKKKIIWIQNDNQNVESINTPKLNSH